MTVVIFLSTNIYFSTTGLSYYRKNGTGKSTLLRLLVGLDTPDSGSIILNKHYPVDPLPKTDPVLIRKTGT
nr:ATP-binding cassette domain-containing protein [Legionella sp. W10-070]